MVPGDVLDPGVDGETAFAGDPDVLVGAGGLAGQPEHGVAVCQQSFRGGVHDPLGDRVGRAGALYNLGSALRLTGSLPAAADALDAAMGIYLELGSRLGQAEVLNHTGDFLLQCGDPVAASALYQRAQRLAREVHSLREGAHALEGAARCALGQHDTDGAVEKLRQAWQTYRQIGAPEAERIAAELAALTSTAPNAA